MKISSLVALAVATVMAVGIPAGLGGCQPVEEGREYQTEAYAQEGVHHAQDDRPLKSVNSGAQHQRAETVHGCFVPVIRAKAQANPSQRTHQRVKSFGSGQINHKKSEGSGNSADDPMPEADKCTAGIWILRQQRCTGKSHPHKPFHPKHRIPGQVNISKAV